MVIVDPSSLTQCQTNKVGEIWLAGPSVAQGYWNRPEETEPRQPPDRDIQSASSENSNRTASNRQTSPSQTIQKPGKLTSNLAQIGAKFSVQWNSLVPLRLDIFPFRSQLVRSYSRRRSAAASRSPPGEDEVFVIIPSAKQQPVL